MTKYTLARRARFALGGVVSFSKFPLSICFTFGFFVSALSLAYGTFAAIEYFVHGARSEAGRR